MGGGRRLGLTIKHKCSTLVIVSSQKQKQLTIWVPAIIAAYASHIKSNEREIIASRGNREHLARTALKAARAVSHSP